MPVLVIGKFDQISIEHKVAVAETTSHYKSIGFPRASHSRVKDPIWSEFEQVRIFTPASLKKLRSKRKVLRPGHISLL